MTNLSNVLAMPWTATNGNECGQAFAFIRRTKGALHKN